MNDITERRSDSVERHANVGIEFEVPRDLIEEEDVVFDGFSVEDEQMMREIAAEVTREEEEEELVMVGRLEAFFSWMASARLDHYDDNGVNSVGSLFQVASQLNGANGEVTGSDDVNTNKKALRKAAKGLAREALKNGVKKATGASQASVDTLYSLVSKELKQPNIRKTLKASLGGVLQRRLNRMFGSGDYVTSETPLTNSLFPGAKDPTTSATFQSDMSNRIRHREFVSQVVGPQAGFAQYAYSTFSVNPGIFSTFPYLSGIAANFEQYRVRGLIFEFVSTSSNYSATTQLGAVMMSAQYRSDASGYSTRMAIENSENCVSGSPDKSMLYGVECEGSRYNSYYVRVGATVTPTVVEDFCKLTVATIGLQVANQILGELWVTYDVELISNKMPILTPGWANILSPVVSQVAPLGTTITSGAYLGSGWTVYKDSSGTRLSLSTGGAPAEGMEFNIILVFSGTSVVIARPAITVTDATVTSLSENGIWNFPANGVTSDNLVIMYRLTVKGPNPNFVLSTGVVPLGSSQILVYGVGAMGPYVSTSSF